MTSPIGRALAAPVSGQVCALFAVDIVGFTRPDRDDDVRMFMREELYRILERAFDGSGTPWTACFREDRGDGVLVVVPPDIAITGIIDPLPERLRSLIRPAAFQPIRFQVKRPRPGPGPTSPALQPSSAVTVP